MISSMLNKLEASAEYILIGLGLLVVSYPVIALTLHFLGVL